jgi:hypothetical protein
MTEENADADDAAKEYYPAYKMDDGTAVEAINTLGVDLTGGSGSQEPQGETIEYLLDQSTNSGNNTTASYGFEGDEVTITNSKSKGYATGNNNGIKYSAGVQYTINIPDNVSISKAEFTGYDNYGDADAYLGEVAGTSYESTQYVFPKKEADGTANVVTRTVELIPAVSDKLTFTPQGKQVVLSIKLTGIKSSTSGISNISATATRNSASYNLSGQKVDANYKGIVICNGRKIIRR